MILQLVIRLLDGRFHGRCDQGEPEWPPSPFRVFQAMLAGAKVDWTDDLANAFRWLERLSPPIIRAPATCNRTREFGEAELPALSYVPNNNSETGRVVRTAKLFAPRLLPPQDNTIEYLWQYAPEDQPLADKIMTCFSKIRCLGWGIDLAVGRGQSLGEFPPPRSTQETHYPQISTNAAGSILRVATPESLLSLEKAHEIFLQRIGNEGEVRDNPGQAHFGFCTYATGVTRPYCAFALRRLDDDEFISFNPCQIKRLVGMIRACFSDSGPDRPKALRDLAGRIRKAIGTEKVDQMLLGHGNDDSPRLSILPLLSVGHDHADGRVRRVIFAEPAGSDGAVCHLLEEMLHQQVLYSDGHLPHEAPDGKPTARLVRIQRGDSYVRKWYVDPARVWASVSPVLLPGFDHRVDRRQGRAHQQKADATLSRAERLVIKALAHASVTESCRIELSPVSWWAGIPHARNFMPREKLGPAPRYHVKLTFDRPYSGPLSLGRQRHTGLGVFARLPSL